MAKVVIGLSGGVDSSVAAWKLVDEGHDVIAVFMRNWHDTTGLLEGDCQWEDDKVFAGLVAGKLGIPFHVVDLSADYRKRVVDYMFEEYKRGRTPNPDVLCNREIKFDSFVKAARKFGAEYVATGHYCRKAETEINGKKIYRLLAGNDPNKDQSYFLCQLSQEQLSKTLFPIGEIVKPEVRRIASELGLASAHKKDSQGICFVGKVDLPEFLQQKLKAQKGKIIEIPGSFYAGAAKEINDIPLAEVCAVPQYVPEDGMVVGEHNGAHFFTIGQRKGLNVGGKKEPLFVIATDIKNNIIYTGQGQSHPGLYRQGLFIPASEIHWVRPDLQLKPDESKDFLIRIRYRQPLQEGTVHYKKEGIYITFKQPQRGITSGQFAAWYDSDELIGSGVIA